VERWPGSKWAVEAQKRLARMYVQIGDYEKADAAAGKLIEAFSNAAGIAAAIEDVADKYQMAGSHAKSYPLHRYVVEHWPENERAIWCQMKAIMSQLRLGDLAKAEEELGNLLSGFAGHKQLGPAVHEVVEEYRDTGAHAEGRELFAYLLENWDETPDTMLELQVGIALQSIKLRELDKADAAIEQLIADYNDNPNLGKGLIQIAEEYYTETVASEAHPVDKVYYENPVKIWERVLKIFPDFFRDDPDLYYFIGDCYRHLGDYEKAIQCYGIVAANWTGDGYAVVPHIAVPLPDDSLSDYEDLHKIIDSLIADFGDHPGLAATILRTGHEHRRRANDARREGLSTDAEVDNLKAIVLYGRVIKEFASSAFTASAYFFSALCYRDLGRWQDALDCSNRLLDNWPGYEYASWVRKLAQNCTEKLATQAK